MESREGGQGGREQSARTPLQERASGDLQSPGDGALANTIPDRPRVSSIRPVSASRSRSFPGADSLELCSIL